MVLLNLQYLIILSNHLSKNCLFWNAFAFEKNIALIGNSEKLDILSK